MEGKSKITIEKSPGPTRTVQPAEGGIAGAARCQAALQHPSDKAKNGRQPGVRSSRGLFMDGRSFSQQTLFSLAKDRNLMSLTGSLVYMP